MSRIPQSYPGPLPAALTRRCVAGGFLLVRKKKPPESTDGSLRLLPECSATPCGDDANRYRSPASGSKRIQLPGGDPSGRIYRWFLAVLGVHTRIGGVVFG